MKFGNFGRADVPARRSAGRKQKKRKEDGKTRAHEAAALPPRAVGASGRYTAETGTHVRVPQSRTRNTGKREEGGRRRTGIMESGLGL